MRVLWFTNIAIGEAPSLMGSSPSVFGGWLDGMFGQLCRVNGVHVSVAFPHLERMAPMKGASAIYYPFRRVPLGEKPHNNLSHDIRAILSDVQPDIVHLFGTELPHAVLVMQLCRELQIPALLQMQGLMGSIWQHYTGWLPVKLTRCATLPERVLGRTTHQQIADFREAGEDESVALRLTNHVLGHTTYDRAWAQQANPAVTYHFAEETLREAFYTSDHWSPRSCDRHSLLVSQASVPYKGAHIAISAMPMILQRFPDSILYIAGPNPVVGSRLMDLVRRSGYGWYLHRLIRRLRLHGKVKFVGPLDQVSMRERYLESHVFLSCSSIENESNSVSEAKILGVPVVASYVGGVTDRIDHGRSGFLYQGDAPYMLAHYVMEIFASDDLASNLGSFARSDALRRHDRQANLDRILEIYGTVIVSSEKGLEVKGDESDR